MIINDLKKSPNKYSYLRNRTNELHIVYNKTVFKLSSFQ